MSKKEVVTDLWVNELLKEAKIKLTAQGCDVLEIDNALKTASKNGTGKVGFPEYCGVVKDFVIVIEDKPTVDKHIKLDENGLLDMSVPAVKDYAMNGVYFYAKHILDKSLICRIY